MPLKSDHTPPVTAEPGVSVQGPAAGNHGAPSPKASDPDAKHVASEALRLELAALDADLGEEPTTTTRPPERLGAEQTGV